MGCCVACKCVCMCVRMCTHMCMYVCVPMIATKVRGQFSSLLQPFRDSGIKFSSSGLSSKCQPSL